MRRTDASIRGHLNSLEDCWKAFKATDKNRSKRLKSIKFLVREIRYGIPIIHKRDTSLALPLERRARKIFKEITSGLVKCGWGFNGMAKLFGVTQVSIVESLRAQHKNMSGTTIEVEAREEEQDTQATTQMHKEDETVEEREEPIIQDKIQVHQSRYEEHTEEEDDDMEVAEQDLQEDEDADDCIITMVIDKRKQAEKQLIEMRMELKDQLLWYQPDNDFDGDWLP